MAEFRRPSRFPPRRFEAEEGDRDPAETSRIAHETAQLVLSRGREGADAELVDRLVAHTDVHGIDTIAELWAHSPATSLPGALWRLYLLRLLIRRDPEGVSLLFQRGVDVSATIDEVVAGAETPTGPEEVMTLADRILRGVFEGDLAVALERAAAFCRATAAGCTSLADDLEPTAPARATELTTRALRYSQLAAELTACARLWRSDSLD